MNQSTNYVDGWGARRRLITLISDGWTWTELASELNLSRRTLARIGSGKAHGCSPSVLSIITESFIPTYPPSALAVEEDVDDLDDMEPLPGMCARARCPHLKGDNQLNLCTEHYRKFERGDYDDPRFKDDSVPVTSGVKQAVKPARRRRRRMQHRRPVLAASGDLTLF